MKKTLIAALALFTQSLPLSLSGELEDLEGKVRQVYDRTVKEGERHSPNNFVTTIYRLSKDNAEYQALSSKISENTLMIFTQGFVLGDLRLDGKLDFARKLENKHYEKNPQTYRHLYAASLENF